MGLPYFLTFLILTLLIINILHPIIGCHAATEGLKDIDFLLIEISSRLSTQLLLFLDVSLLFLAPHGNIGLIAVHEDSQEQVRKEEVE